MRHCALFLQQFLNGAAQSAHVLEDVAALVNDLALKWKCSLDSSLRRVLLNPLQNCRDVGHQEFNFSNNFRLCARLANLVLQLLEEVNVLVKLVDMRPITAKRSFDNLPNRLKVWNNVLANILRLGFADKEVIDIYMFMGIAATLVSPSFEKTVLNLFKIFEDDQCKSKIPTAAFINFYEFMSSKDPSIPAGNLQKLKDEATDEFIDAQMYQRIFTSDE